MKPSNIDADKNKSSDYSSFKKIKSKNDFQKDK